jgi:tRNA dimethylallyltransferase
LPVKKNRKYLFVIAGPTAVGKTDVAIEVARHFDAEILSADSRQFYKTLDIGTAKPSAEQLSLVKHHFISHLEPGELYGAGHFERDALKVLDSIYKSNDKAILTGGSGLYIDALLEGIDQVPEADIALREKLNASYKKKGLEWLQSEVMLVDPEFLVTADSKNPQRLLRALEVCLISGKPYSAFRKKKESKRDFIPIKILLNLNRTELYQRIEARVDRMMEQGLVDEVRRLLPHRNVNALKTVGYKELFGYLDGEMSLKEAVDKIKQHTRNYAKRQLTWFRNRGGYKELLPDAEAVIAYIDSTLKG